MGLMFDCPSIAYEGVEIYFYGCPGISTAFGHLYALILVFLTYLGINGPRQDIGESIEPSLCCLCNRTSILSLQGN